MLNYVDILQFCSWEPQSLYIRNALILDNVKPVQRLPAKLPSKGKGKSFGFGVVAALLVPFSLHHPSCCLHFGLAFPLSESSGMLKRVPLVQVDLKNALAALPWKSTTI